MWHACRSVAAHALSMDPLVKGRDFVHRAMPVVVHKLVGDEVSREYNRGLWERRCQLERAPHVNHVAKLTLSTLNHGVKALHKSRRLLQWRQKGGRRFSSL